MPTDPKRTTTTWQPEIALTTAAEDRPSQEQDACPLSHEMSGTTHSEKGDACPAGR